MSNGEQQSQWPQCEDGHGDMQQSTYEDKQNPGQFGFYCATQGCKCRANPDGTIWWAGGSTGQLQQRPVRRPRPAPARPAPAKPAARDPNALTRAMNTSIMSAAQVYEGLAMADSQASVDERVLALAKRLFLELAAPVAAGQKIGTASAPARPEPPAAPEPRAFDPEPRPHPNEDIPF